MAKPWEKNPRPKTKETDEIHSLLYLGDSEKGSPLLDAYFLVHGILFLSSSVFL